MSLFNEHDAFTAIWTVGLRRIVMSKILFVVLASAISLSVTPSFSWAQSTNNPCPCSCVIVTGPSAASEAQTNRRFSYEPAPSVQPNTLGGATIASTLTPSQPNGPITSTQSIRRFSYQPTQSVNASRSNHTDQPWRYSKTDPRRYR